jgi:UDP-N-acetylglucosamine--N-acetylmuramyl-(pentapeptide) pyrophosphoryl-undecaprenol N-acetylglucosamine transferase
MNVAVACGGTGGHIFPGLVTARELKRRGHDVTLWLAGRSIEAASVGDWDGPIERVRASGLGAGGAAGAVGAVFRMARAVWDCRRRMAAARPDVLLAMGSYASVGPGLAAWSLRIPLVLHEANAVPGRAISFLSRFAAATGIAFESAARGLRCRRIVATGMPLRDRDAGALRHAGLAEGRFTLLVMGGSQGAHALNAVVPAAVARARAAGADLQVIHLCGVADEARVRDAYASGGIPHAVFGFLAQMSQAYNRADFAICRAGAATCAELALHGVPALLVPYPLARRDHQAANAMALAAGGGVDVLDESGLAEASLAEYLTGVVRDERKRDRMRESVQAALVPGAASRLADLVESCRSTRDTRRG